MLRKVNDLIDKAESGRRKRPIRFMVIVYGVLWLLLCLVLTSVLGKPYMQRKTAEIEKYWNDTFQRVMRDFEVKASQPDFRFADNKDYFAYKMAMLEDCLEVSDNGAYGLFQTQLYDQDAILDVYYQHLSGYEFKYGSVSGALEQIEKNTVNLRDVDKVILEAYYADEKERGRAYWEDCHLTWGTCSAEKYQIVLEEVEKLKAEGYEVFQKAESRLTSYRNASDSFDWSLSFWVQDEIDDEGSGYLPETEEFYINEEHEFIPKTVVVWYKKPSEEKYHAHRVTCYEGDCPDGYRYVKTGLSATRIPNFSEGRCDLISEVELLTKGAENYGNRLTYAYWERMAKALYLNPGDQAIFTLDLMLPTWNSGEKPIASRYEYFFTWYRDNFDQPFLDVTNNSFAYAVRFDGSTSDGYKFGLSKPFSYFSGDIYVNYYNSVNNEYTGEQIRVFVSCVIPGIFRWMAKEFLLKMLWVYLGILLFFAALGWWNYKRLYTIRGKNLFYRTLLKTMEQDPNASQMDMEGYSENLKETIHPEELEAYVEQPIFLSELVKAAVERNRELLMEKNTPILFSGETLLTGDTEIWSLVVDKLIVNAVKNSFENGQIEVVGTKYSFSVIHSAKQSYGKHLKHLLDPWEMEDESGATGEDRGLELAMANGIVQGHGGRIRLSYDKMTKKFISEVRPKKVWKRTNGEDEE